MNNKKKRLDWIDMAKGYGIIMVILGHTNFPMLTAWVYSFHIPLFFFLSGYVFSNRLSFGKFVKRKSCSILLPYVTLGTPMIIFDILYHHKNLQELLIDYITQQRLWTLWYIIVLYELNIIFYIMTKVLRLQGKLLYGIVIVIGICGLVYYQLGGQELPWNIDICMTSLVFFAAGYLVKSKIKKIEKVLLDKKKIFAVFVGTIILNYGLQWISFEITGDITDMFYNQYGIQILYYIMAFAGIVWVVLVSRRFTLKGIRYLGKNSMIFFAWHQTIIMPGVERIMDKLNVFSGKDIFDLIMYKSIEILIVIGILIVINEVMIRTKLKVMLGDLSSFMVSE